MRRVLKRGLAAVALAVAAFLGASTFVALRYRDRVVAAADAPRADVALVFGAGLSPNAQPSPVLAERLDAAQALFEAGKVSRLILTGATDTGHDEPAAMRRYLIARGVPDGALTTDPSGDSTYDSCYRARAVFGVRRALLVTQEFHLPRALFIANSLGIEAHGVRAGESAGVWHLRELFSRPLALAMVLTRRKPDSVGGGQ